MRIQANPAYFPTTRLKQHITFGSIEPTKISQKPSETAKAYPKPNAKEWFLELLTIPSKLYVRHRLNIQQIIFEGHEKIQAALDKGAHVIIGPNHPGHGDILMMHPLYRAIGRKPFNILVADFFFNNHFISEKWRHKLLNWRGMFPLNREIVDKTAITTAIDVVTQGKNPLAIFPEGISTGQNDHLSEIKEGIAMIGLTAAKNIAKGSQPEDEVMIFPVAIRHHFNGDIRPNLAKHLARLEKQLNLPIGDAKNLDENTLLKRTETIGRAVLSFREKAMLGTNSDTTGMTWEQAHQTVMHSIAEHIANEVGLAVTPTATILEKHRDIIGKLKLMARAAEQAGNKAEIKRVKHLNTSTKPLLDNLYEMLKFSPAYTQGVVNQHRLAEGLYRIDAVMNGNVSKVITSVGPRTTCLKVGDPINLSDLLKTHDGRKGNLREEVAKTLREKLESLLADGNPKP